MSLNNNIIEKVYHFLEKADTSLDFNKNSEDILLERHYDDLRIDNLTSDLRAEDMDKLREGLAESNVSEQKYLLNMIIHYLTVNLIDLHTKEDRLEFFINLPSLFKLIYQSLYEIWVASL